MTQTAEQNRSANHAKSFHGDTPTPTPEIPMSEWLYAKPYSQITINANEQHALRNVARIARGYLHHSQHARPCRVAHLWDDNSQPIVHCI
jgi:hypothetical protein